MKKIGSGFTVGKSDIYSPSASITRGDLVDYDDDIINKPSLVDLHRHDNRDLLDKITSIEGGNEVWTNSGDYKTIGEIYEGVLGDNTDVNISSPSDENVLLYSASLGEWINAQQSWISEGDSISALTNDVGYLTELSFLDLSDVAESDYTGLQYYIPFVELIGGPRIEFVLPTLDWITSRGAITNNPITLGGALTINNNLTVDDITVGDHTSTNWDEAYDWVETNKANLATEAYVDARIIDTDKTLGDVVTQGNTAANTFGLATVVGNVYFDTDAEGGVPGLHLMTAEGNSQGWFLAGSNSSEIQTQLSAGSLSISGDNGIILNNTNIIKGMSISETLAEESNTLVASQKAIKNYIQNVISSTNYLDVNIVAASTANWDLVSGPSQGNIVDGVTLSTGDHILLKDQSIPSHNGIWVVQASEGPIRDTLMDAGAEFYGATVFVSGGTLNAGTTWKCISTVTDVGTDPVVFTKIGQSVVYTGGSGIDITGTDISVNEDYIATRDYVGDHIFSGSYTDLTDKPSIAYSSVIPADDFNSTEVANLKADQLASGSTPWAANNYYDNADVLNYLSPGSGITFAPSPGLLEIKLAAGVLTSMPSLNDITSVGYISNNPIQIAQAADTGKLIFGSGTSEFSIFRDGSHEYLKIITEGLIAATIRYNQLYGFGDIKASGDFYANNGLKKVAIQDDLVTVYDSSETPSTGKEGDIWVDSSI